MPKPNRLDFILEKGTELGVDAFWVFPGQLSIKKEFFPHQMERAQSLLVAAMKQCGRLTLPTLHLQPPLTQWTTFPSTAFFGDLSPEALPFEIVWKQSTGLTSPFLFITGPESGLTSQEEQFLKEGGVKGVRLHPYILRTDTASLMAVSLLSHWLLTPSI
jgi:16S rRNA (uracil1498-N3)-methyltransferase